MEKTPLSRADRGASRWAIWVVPLVILIVFRIHALGEPLERDECNYAYIAERLLEGGRLYVDVWDHQPPGVYALYAGAIALLGKSPLAPRLLALGFSAISLLLLIRIAKRHLTIQAAWFSGLLFAFVSSDPGTAGEGGNREIFMNFLCLSALTFLVSNDSSPRGPWSRSVKLIAAGACLGLASLLKTIVAVLWLAWAAYLIVRAAAADRTIAGMRKALGDAFLFAIGPALAWLAAFIYFTAVDRFEAFYYATFTYNLTYSELPRARLDRFIGFFAGRWDVFVTALPLWICGGFGLLFLRFWRPGRLEWPVGLYGLASFIEVCLPGRFWNHYYYLMMPPLALGSALGLARMLEHRHRTVRRFGQATAVAALLTLLGGQWIVYLSVDPNRIDWRRYGPRMTWARDQGWRVGSVTQPGDTIYINASDVGVYYYADRRCATRFTMTEPLLRDHPQRAVFWNQFLSDLTADPPRMILLLRPPSGEFQQFVESRYRVIGQDSQLDDDDATQMIIVGDPSRPVESINWDWTPQLYAPQ